MPRSPLATAADRALSGANALLASAARAAWPGPAPRAPERVCVWRTGNVGDVVCALPALAAVRHRWPEAQLTLLTSPGAPGAPGARELLADAPWIDDLWVYHPGDLAPRSFAAALAARRFDALVRLPQNMSSPRRELRDLAFLRGLARVPWARGFGVGGLRWLSRGAGRALARGRELAHESRRLLDLVADAVGRVDGAEFPLPIDDAVRAEAERLLGERGAGLGALLCVAPGAKRDTNRWPAERFAEIARRWTARGLPVAVVGGPGEGALGARVASAAGPLAADLCGRSSLLASAALFQRSAAVVSNDSGALHLAAAVGTPVVSPFTARDAAGRWFPLRRPGRPAHAVLRREPPCSPCWVERCPHDNRCLTEISTEEVWSALEPLAAPARTLAAAG